MKITFALVFCNIFLIAICISMQFQILRLREKINIQASLTDRNIAATEKLIDTVTSTVKLVDMVSSNGRKCSRP